MVNVDFWIAQNSVRHRLEIRRVGACMVLAVSLLKVCFRFKMHIQYLQLNWAQNLSTTRKYRVIPPFKTKYQNKLIIWIWGSARYTIRILTAVCKHAFRSDVTFFVTYTYFKCILVSEIVIWLGSRRVTSHKMENPKNSLKIDVRKWRYDR